MPNAEKIEKVATLKERIQGSQAVLLTDHRGLSVADAKDLRTALREADTAFSIVKNTLLQRAAADAGIEDLASLVEGPTAVAFVRGDPVLAAKRLTEAAKRFPSLVLKGGFVEGRVLSAEEATTLAKLESREAMLSRVAGMAKSEMSRAASMFQALQGRFLGLLDALREKLPAEEAAPAGEPEPATAGDGPGATQGEVAEAEAEAVEAAGAEAVDAEGSSGDASPNEDEEGKE